MERQTKKRKMIREKDESLDSMVAQSSNGHSTSGSKRPFKRLPDRWLHCPLYGKVVSELFLPMKTPLDSSYDRFIPDKMLRFYPKTAMEVKLIGAKPHSKIGLWIDLTNSLSFYNKNEVEECGCVYKKIRLAGHKQTPSPKQVDEFISTVEQHLESHPDDIVAVHCTHGFNRTGFLISVYLHHIGWSIDTAVEEFARCRPFGIYKQHYLDDMAERYGNGDTEFQMEAPEKPNWDQETLSNGADDFSNDVYDPVQMSDSCEHVLEPSTSVSKPTSFSNLPKFLDGRFPEVTYIENSNEREFLQSKAQKFCHYSKEDFPGSQPISLERWNIHFLEESPYMVSWKADGLRYLILIDGKDQVYAFDRNNNVFSIPRLNFPSKNSRDPSSVEYLQGTLVDAEMVIDEYKNPKGVVEKIPRLLIYDIISLQNVNVGNEEFPRRFQMIQTEIIDPRTFAFKAGLLVRDNELMGVRRKDFYHIAYAHKFFSPNFLGGCSHEIDGLVFQPYLPYKSGRFDRLLKWKPPEQSTIDFKLRFAKVQQPGCLPEFVAQLFVLGLDAPFANIVPAPKSLKPYDGKIIECHFNMVTKKWEFMRERTDKSHPNALHTAQSVARTIQNPTTRDDLLRYIHDRGYGVSDELAAHERRQKTAHSNANERH